MARLKDLDTAKHEAVSTTLGLIFWAFVAALVIAYGLPALLAVVLDSSTNNATRTTATVFSSLTTGLFFMWLSSDRLKSTVGVAVEAAANQKLDEYKRQHPSLEETSSVNKQEYACSIPPINQSESSIRYSSPDSPVCRKRLGRDAVIRSLAYNKILLQGIALAAVERTLEQINGNRRKEKLISGEEVLFNDIYVYLKGWLMMSITHDCTMPINYIEQRYPNVNHPDHLAYITSIEIVRKECIQSNKIVSAISYAVKDDEYPDIAASQAIDLLDNYLGILISELKKNAS